MRQLGIADYRFRNLALMGLLIMLLNLTAWILAGVLILPEHRLLEDEWGHEQILRVQSILDREAGYLQQLVVDGAAKKRVSNFVQNPERDRFPRTITAETFENTHISAVVLFDTRGQVLFSRGYDLTAGTMADVPAVLMGQLRRLPALLAESGRRAGLSGYLSCGSLPVLAAAAPVLEGDGAGSAHPVLVYASILDGHVAQYLQDLARLDLRVSTVTGPMAADLRESVQRQGKTLRLARIIPGLLAPDALRLEVSVPRTIFNHARASVDYFLGWVLGSSLIFAGLIYLALNRAARLEAKKAERDRLVRDLLQHSRKAIVLVSLGDQRVLEANLEAQSYFEIVDHPLASEVFRDVEGQLCWEQMRSALESGTGQNLQLQLLSRAGQTLQLEVSSSRLVGDKSPYLLLQFWDVSAHKAAEIALQTSVERYRLLFNGSPIPMWVYDAESLRFVDVNEAAIAQYGYSREEFLQLTILELRPEDDADQVRALVARLVRAPAGEISGPQSVGVWSHRRRDGSCLLADISVVKFDLHGRPAILTSAVDITVKVANEKALIASEERYRQMFNHLPLPMWVVDMATLRYLDVNQTAVEKYGYSHDEFLAMTISDLHASGDRQQGPTAVSSLETRQEQQRIWQYRCKDGRVLDVEIIMRDIPFEERIACLVIANDVTEKERLRAEAESVSRLAALGELSAGIAHEINNPNGMIQINLQLVADAWRDLQPLLAEKLLHDPDWSLAGLPAARLQADMPDLLDEMQSGTQRIRDIVEDLKDFARHDEPSLEEKVDPNQVVDAAVRMVKNQIRKTGAHFHAALGQDIPAVRGNFRQLEQVLINLLMNACQALEGSGQRLAVVTRFDAAVGEVTIEVADSGRGIEAKDLLRISEPFFTTRRNEGGTGLGLSVSTRIARDHGGRLSFKSKPGEGTLAQLILPAMPEESP